MKTILLVDDENSAREHIKKSFPWSEWGYKIIGEAHNGLEALNFCRKIQPDIALIDITMPVMDGLTLMEYLNREFPHIVSIVVTAYRDFEYAQRALQMGAAGYILKSPISVQETKNALDRAAFMLKRESDFQQTSKLVRTNQYPLRKHFWDQLTTGVLSKDSEILERGMEIGMSLAADCSYIVVAEIEGLDDFMKQYPAKDYPLIEFSMLEIVQETLQQGIKGTFEIIPVRIGHFLIYIMQDHPEPVKQKETVYWIAERLSYPMEKYMDLRLMFSVSELVQRPERLKEAYRKACRSLILRFYQKRGQPIFQSNVAPFSPPDHASLAKWKNELQSILDDYAPDRLTSWIGRVKDYFYIRKTEPDQVKAWFNSLHLLCSHSGNKEAMPDYNRCLHLEEAFEQLERCVRSWDQSRKLALSYRPEVLRVIRYVKANLAHDITLDDIAAEACMSPSYLGQLFKKEVGSTIMDYVLEQRMELAKSYLKEGVYRNYELAEKIGFRYYSHFSNMFKKYTGMSPNAFKRSAGTVFEHTAEKEDRRL